MEIEIDEAHVYDGGSVYRLNKFGNENYNVIAVRGYLDQNMHVFSKGVDYELRRDTIIWLNEDKPGPAPSHLDIPKKWFYVTYTYEASPASTIKSSIYPFMPKDGTLAMVVDSFGQQFRRFMRKKNSFVTDKDIRYAKGNELDRIADWFDASRLGGESDVSFRSRLQDFISTYLSSGNRQAIKNVIEASIGVEPTILELWGNVSYYNYDPDNPEISYVYNSTTNPVTETDFHKICKYRDYSDQPATFYVILDYDTIIEHGIDFIKSLINESKASGVTGYLGYLVNETFSVDASNWIENSLVLSGTDTSSGTWSVTSSLYEYDGAGGTNGLSIIDSAKFSGCGDWQNYQVTLFANDVLGNAGNRVGIMLRWTPESTESEEGYGYFIGFSTDTDNIHIYSNTSGGFTEMVETASGKTLNADTQYHLRVEISGTALRIYLDNDSVYDSTSSGETFDKLGTENGRIGVAALTDDSNASGTGDGEMVGNAIKAQFDDIVVVA